MFILEWLAMNAVSDFLFGFDLWLFISLGFFYTWSVHSVTNDNDIGATLLVMVLLYALWYSKIFVNIGIPETFVTEWIYSWWSLLAYVLIGIAYGTAKYIKFFTVMKGEIKSLKEAFIGNKLSIYNESEKVFAQQYRPSDRAVNEVVAELEANKIPTELKTQYVEYLESADFSVSKDRIEYRYSHHNKLRTKSWMAYWILYISGDSIKVLFESLELFYDRIAKALDNTRKRILKDVLSDIS